MARESIKSLKLLERLPVASSLLSSEGRKCQGVLSTNLPTIHPNDRLHLLPGFTIDFGYSTLQGDAGSTLASLILSLTVFFPYHKEALEETGCLGHPASAGPWNKEATGLT